MNKRHAIEAANRLNAVIHSRNLYRNGTRVINARAFRVVDDGVVEYCVRVDALYGAVGIMLVESDKLVDGNGSEVKL